MSEQPRYIVPVTVLIEINAPDEALVDERIATIVAVMRRRLLGAKPPGSGRRRLPGNPHVVAVEDNHPVVDHRG